MEAELCPTCGLLIGGNAATEFWRLHARIERLCHLRDEALAELRPDPIPSQTNQPSQPAGPSDSTPRPTFPGSGSVSGVGQDPLGWLRGFTVRDFLLTLGVFSLIVAVASFAVVSWDDLSTAGRVGLVVGVTALTGGSGVALFRRQFEATAEAVAVFWAALLAADVAAGRVLLAPDSPPLVVWAIGLTVVAALLIGFGSITPSRSAPSLGLVAAVLPLPLLALEQGSEILAAGAGLVAVGVVSGAATSARLRSGRFGEVIIVGLQHSAWIFATAAVLVGLAFNDVGGVVALAIATVVLIAGAGLAGNDGPRLRAQAWMAKAALLAIAAPFVVVERFSEGPWAVLVAAIVAATVLAAAGRGSSRGREGAIVIATGGILILALTPVAVLLLQSLDVLLKPASDHWTGSAGHRLQLSDPLTISEQLVAIGLLITLIATTADQLRSRFQWRWLGEMVLGVVAILTVPVLFGAPTWAVTSILIVVGVAGLAIAVAKDSVEIGLAGVALTVVGLSVSLATPTLTIAALAVVSAASWTLVFRSPVGSTPEHVAVLVATAVGATSTTVLAVTANIGWSAGAVAVAVELTAGVLLMPLPVIAHLPGTVESRRSRWHSPPVPMAYELSGVAVGLLALRGAVATGQLAFITWALVIAAIVSLIHSTRPDRSWLLVVAAGLVAAAAEVQLGVADVGLVEVYVVPVVLAAGVFGWYVHREMPESSSWITWGPVTAIAFVPSLVVALGRDAGLRPLLLPVVAIAVVELGVMLRKQAPLVIGAIVMALIGLDFLGRFASHLPNWIPFGLAGLVLLVLGADFERSRDRVRRFTLQIQELD